MVPEKFPVDQLNARVNYIKKISELEGTTMEIIKTEAQKEKTK